LSFEWQSYGWITKHLHLPPPLQENIITAVNSDPSATWVAGENERLEDFTVSVVRLRHILSV
jgi:hypothetical protein